MTSVTTTWTTIQYQGSHNHWNDEQSGRHWWMPTSSIVTITIHSRVGYVDYRNVTAGTMTPLVR